MLLQKNGNNKHRYIHKCEQSDIEDEKEIAALFLRVREYKVPGARQLTSNYNANCTAVANEDFC